MTLFLKKLYFVIDNPAINAILNTYPYMEANFFAPKSAEWCLKAVDQCWKMKEGNIRAEDRADAEVRQEITIMG
ncbi:MAG: hypothetical protein ABIN25_06740 [Ginsengibacter sp.]